MAHEQTTRRRATANRAVAALPPVALRALVFAGKKKRILDETTAQKLISVCQQSGISTIPEIRKFLLAGQSNETSQALVRLLPPDEAPPLGGYQLLAHLADGGMGQVWITVAPDGISLSIIKCSRPVAKEDMSSMRLRRRFEREAAVHRRLHHPNVLRCIDSGVSETGVCYMVLEFVKTGDLSDLVTERGTLPESVALDLAYQVADGLNEAHRIRLVHRDIKPSNVFISADGVAKLSDFGVARQDGEGGTQLTMSGTVLGSPYYMSPEQVNAADDIDIRADIYAIGGLLCFCLTGQPPFPGRPLEAMHGHVKTPAPDLSQTYESVSKSTARLICRCMAKDREQRFADPAELRAAIAEAKAACSGQDLFAWMRGNGEADLTEVDGNETLPPGAMTPGVDMEVAAPASSAPSGASPVLPAPNSSPIRFREPEELLALASGVSPRSLNTSRVENPAAVSKRLVLNPSVQPWLVLVDTTGKNVVHLFARESLTLGKLAKAPVDITTVLYPIDRYADISNRISRSHCVLRASDVGYTIMDMESSNGTELDGRMLAPNVATPIPEGKSWRIGLAGAIDLEVKGVPHRSTEAPPQDLLEGTSDALVITRPTNRPEMAYVLVRRRVMIGGLGADLILPNGVAAKGVEVALAASGWMWRGWQTGRSSGAWEKMKTGSQVVGGGFTFAVHAGAHGYYTKQT